MAYKRCKSCHAPAGRYDFCDDCQQLQNLAHTVQRENDPSMAAAVFTAVAQRRYPTIIPATQPFEVIEICDNFYERKTVVAWQQEYTSGSYLVPLVISEFGQAEVAKVPYLLHDVSTGLCENNDGTGYENLDTALKKMCPFPVSAPVSLF